MSTVRDLCIIIFEAVKIAWLSSKLYTLLRPLCKLISSIAILADSVVLKLLIDSLTNTQFRVEYLVLITMLHVLILICDRSSSYMQEIHDKKIVYSISHKITDSSLNAQVSLFDDPSYYNRLLKLQQDVYSFSFILWFIIDLVISCINFIISVVYVSKFNVLFSIILILCSIPCAITGGVFTKKIIDVDIENLGDERRVSYLNSISCSKDFAFQNRLFDLRSMIRKKLNYHSSNIIGRKKKILKKQAIFVGFFQAIPRIASFYFLYILALQIKMGEYTVGDFALYFSMFGQLIDSTFLVISSLINVYDNKLKIDNYRFLNTIPTESGNGGVDIQTIESIEFVDVSFSYNGTNALAVKNISFSINRGQSLALLGSNGSGKTTIIKLLMKYYLPTSGKILINGIDINLINTRNLRKNISAYFQNSGNYAFSIVENITLKDDFSEEDAFRVNKILESLGASNITKKSGNGIMSNLTRMFDPLGLELSVGESQKIALARTLYRRSSLIIFDEPSSSLDSHSESLAFDCFKAASKDLTSVYISHNWDKVDSDDLIILLENGIAVECGVKRDLSNNKKSCFYKQR